MGAAIPCLEALRVDNPRAHGESHQPYDRASESGQALDVSASFCSGAGRQEPRRGQADVRAEQPDQGRGHRGKPGQASAPGGEGAECGPPASSGFPGGPTLPNGDWGNQLGLHKLPPRSTLKPFEELIKQVNDINTIIEVILNYLFK